MIKGKFVGVSSIITFSVCAALFLSGLAFASEMELLWVAEYIETEKPLYNEVLSAMEIEVDGNGNTYVGGTFYRHYFLVKYDPEGNEEWVRKYEDAYASFHRERIKVRLDSSGNVCLIVYSASSGKTYGTWKTMKLDPDGNLLWERVFDLGRTVYFGFVAGIDGDDSLYITGMAYPGYAIVKYDSDGNQIWSDVRNYTNYFYYPTGLDFDGDGNVYVSGRSSIGRVVKYDSIGNLIWAVQFGGEAGSANGLAVDSSGVYVSGYISRSDGTYQGVLSKYDPDGNIIWSSVNETRTQYPYGGNLAVDRSGDLVAVDAEGRESCRYCHVGGYADPAYVSKYDPDGNLLWKQELEEGGTKGISSLNLDDEGNIFLSGAVNEDGVRFLNLKFSSDGDLLWRDASYFTIPNVSYRLNILIDAGLDGFGNLYATGFSYGPKLALTVKYGSANQPPTADAGPNQTIGCSGPDGTQVTLDGSGSSAPGDTLTYSWTWPGGSAAGASPTIQLPYGDTTVTLTVDDGKGGTAADTVTISVRDTTPPATTVRGIVGIAGNNGWHTSDVLITVDSTDSCSGVKEIRSIVDGNATTTPGGTATIPVLGDGSHVVSFAATDNAGNVEQQKTLTIRIDKTAPDANISTAPGFLWPPNHKMMDVSVNGGATDSTSGVASVVFTVTDEYATVQPAVSGFNTTVPLEAWREGTDKDGRHYTITAVVTDTAGNTTTVSTEAVCPHDMRQGN